MRTLSTKQSAMRDRQVTRICSRCPGAKPVTAFAVNTNKQGVKVRRSICKTCDRIYRDTVKARKAQDMARKAQARLADVTGGKRAQIAPQVNYAPAIGPVVSKSGCGCPVEVHKGISYKMCQPASCQTLSMNQLDGIKRGYRLEPPA